MKNAILILHQFYSKCYKKFDRISKVILCYIIAFLVIFSMCGCGKREDWRGGATYVWVKTIASSSNPLQQPNIVIVPLKPEDDFRIVTMGFGEDNGKIQFFKGGILMSECNYYHNTNEPTHYTTYLSDGSFNYHIRNECGIDFNYYFQYINNVWYAVFPDLLQLHPELDHEGYLTRTSYFKVL